MNTTSQTVSDAVLTPGTLHSEMTPPERQHLANAYAAGSASPLTVLMTTDTVGGVLVFAAILARALARYNVSVVLAAMGAPPGNEWRAYFKSLGNVRLFECDGKLEWMADPWSDVQSAGDWLRRLADRSSPNLVHLNNYAHAAMDWPCPVILTAHSCVYSWHRDVRGAKPGRQWKRYFCCAERALQMADLVTAPTWSFLRTLRDIYGSFRSLGAIYNGMEVDTETAPDSGEKEPLVFAAGRFWDEGKNLAILKKVQPLVKTPIYAAGSLHHPDGWMADPGGLRHIGVLGPAQIRRWYQRAAVYVLPALYEPFGLSALEAACAGCALVLSDIPSLREIWADAALFADPRDEKALARALDLLTTDPALRQEYAGRARRRAMLYPAEKMGRRYFDLYTKLLTHEPIYSSMAAAVMEGA